MIGKITIEDNSADSIKDNIKAVGETISGKIVNLVASNDVFLQAAMNTSEKLENAKSKGWSVGANISVTGGGILDFDASANAVKEKGNMSSSNGKMRSNYVSIIDQAAISNGTIEVRDSDFNIQTLSRDTKESLNKLDEIFDKKKIEERQELSKLFAKENPDVAQILSALLGAAGAKADAYYDTEKRKGKIKFGLAGGYYGGALGVVIEENEDQKKNRKN